MVVGAFGHHSVHARKPVGEDLNIESENALIRLLLGMGNLVQVSQMTRGRAILTLALVINIYDQESLLKVMAK